MRTADDALLPAGKCVRATMVVNAMELRETDDGIAMRFVSIFNPCLPVIPNWVINWHRGVFIMPPNHTANVVNRD